MSWTEDRVAVLTKLWGEGRTAAEIAKILGGVTRNAVIGKAHRLKLSGRTSPIPENSKKKDEKATKKTPQKMQKAPEISSRPSEKASSGMKLIDIKDRMCRWPIGDPRDADFHFCGCKTIPGLPYCAEHVRMAYQASSRNRILKAEEFDEKRLPQKDDETVHVA